MSKLQDIDQEIATLERLLANAHERRREEVNRRNINKCDHVWARMIQDQHFTCGRCGDKKPL